MKTWPAWLKLLAACVVCVAVIAGLVVLVKRVV
jgi:hypothetical protein